MSENTQVRGFRLTFAELEVLNGDSPKWPRARKVIGFDVPLYQGIIQGCGLASLLAREYAVVKGDDIMVSDSLTEIAGRLLDSTHWVGVTVGNPDGIVSTMYGVNDNSSGRVYIAGVAPGVIEVLPFVDVPTPVEQLEQIIATDLKAGDLTLAIKPEAGAPMLIRRLSGQWLLGDAANPEAPYVASSQAEVMAKAHDLLVANLP